MAICIYGKLTRVCPLVTMGKNNICKPTEHNALTPISINGTIYARIEYIDILDDTYRIIVPEFLNGGAFESRQRYQLIFS